MNTHDVWDGQVHGRAVEFIKAHFEKDKDPVTVLITHSRSGSNTEPVAPFVAANLKEAQDHIDRFKGKTVGIELKIGGKRYRVWHDRVKDEVAIWVKLPFPA